MSAEGSDLAFRNPSEAHRPRWPVHSESRRSLLPNTAWLCFPEESRRCEQFLLLLHRRFQQLFLLLPVLEVIKYSAAAQCFRSPGMVSA